MSQCLAQQVDEWVPEPGAVAVPSNTTQSNPADTAAVATGSEAPSCAIPLFDPSEPRIKFYSKSADAQVKSLSNFANLRVTVDGCNYPTGEHAFHGRKYTEAASATDGPLRREKLLTHARKFVQGGAVGISGLDAKRAGGKGKTGLMLEPAELRGWAEASVAVQNRICEYKFRVYSQVRMRVVLFLIFKRNTHLPLWQVRQVLEQSANCELLHQNNRCALEAEVNVDQKLDQIATLLQQVAAWCWSTWVLRQLVLAQGTAQ